MEHLTITDVREREYGFYKFVKIYGEYRFIDCSEVSFWTHLDLVTPEEYDSVESAGSISVFSGYWKVASSYSDSLMSRLKDKNFACFGQKDVDELKKLLSPRGFKDWLENE